MAGSGWTIHRVPLGEWTVELYELSVQEMQQLQQAYGSAQAEGTELNAEELLRQVVPVLLGVIKSWTCVNRSGEPMPLTVEGFMELPGMAVMEFINEVATLGSRGEAIPKAVTTTLQ